MTEKERVVAAFEDKGFTTIEREGRFEYVDIDSGDIASVSWAADGEDDWNIPETFATPVQMQLISEHGEFLDAVDFPSVTKFIEGWRF